jgi:hypothetical protein
MINDKKIRCRYELGENSVKNILDDILASEHISFDDSKFETLLSKYVWIAMAEAECRQKLLEIIWKN